MHAQNLHHCTEKHVVVQHFILKVSNICVQYFAHAVFVKWIAGQMYIYTAHFILPELCKI